MESSCSPSLGSPAPKIRVRAGCRGESADRSGTMSLLARLRLAVDNAKQQRERIRKWSPVLLFIVLLVYIFLGATAFLFFEHSHHESLSSRLRLNRIASRRQFARLMSTRIFNDTRNLLIIIDREQTTRVQDILVDSLKRYEDQIAVKLPQKSAWNLLNSLNYAYGLLLTVGHGQKVPETIGGQVFALIYAAFGIPFFLGTLALIVYRLLLPLFQCATDSSRRRQPWFWISLVVFVAWTLLLATYLYVYIFESFWASLFAATLGSFTVQIFEYDSFSPCSLLVLLLGITVSVVLVLATTFLFIAAHGNFARRPSVKIAASPPKFTVIVDEAGESKLAE